MSRRFFFWRRGINSSDISRLSDAPWNKRDKLLWIQTPVVDVSNRYASDLQQCHTIAIFRRPQLDIINSPDADESSIWPSYVNHTDGSTRHLLPNGRLQYPHHGSSRVHSEVLRSTCIYNHNTFFLCMHCVVMCNMRVGCMSWGLSCVGKGWVWGE